MNKQPIALITAPFGSGAGTAGAEHGPQSLIDAGLVEKLRLLHGDVIGPIDIALPKVAKRCCGLISESAGNSEFIKNVEQVAKMSALTAEQIQRAVRRQQFPMLLGGDHSVAIGSMAGLVRSGLEPGVIWFDAHGDLNTEHTSPTRNAHGMVLAIALGLTTTFRLTDICGVEKPIRKQNVVLVGARDLDPGERRLILDEGIHCFTISDIDKLGIAETTRRALAIAGSGTDSIHVSLDMDALDPVEAPGVGTPVPGGLTFREARTAMEALGDSGKVTSLDIVEVNPLLDNGQRTTMQAIELAQTLMGKRLL